MRRLKCDFHAIAAIALLFGAIAFQAWVGLRLWGSDPVHPDEGAHFTTGVMISEFLKTAHFTAPLDFAREFYLKYPKVALGHWPPLYYLIQAGFYSLFGASIGVDRALSALILAIAALCLLLRSARLHATTDGTTGGTTTTWTAGAASAACLLAMPGVMANSWLLMSDLLVSLFMFLAAMALADLLDSGRAAHAALFAIWSVAAILTKGNGWALGILAVIAPLILRRWDCFRNRWYWAAAVVIVIASAPFYVMARSLGVGYTSDGTHLVSPSIDVADRFAMWGPAWQLVSPTIWLVAAVAVLWGWRRLSTAEWTAVALILAQFIFVTVLPLTGEPRYYLPSAFALALLLSRVLTVRGRTVGILVLLLASLPGALRFRLDRIDGYRAVADALPYPSQGTVILAASDSVGEGAFIARRLEHDAHRAGVVLRGTKVLSESTWSGSRYKLRFASPEKVLDYLRSVPVRYVVLDRSAAPLPHNQLLETALLHAPDEFVQLALLPVSGIRNGQVVVYENTAARGREAQIHLDVAGHAVDWTIK